MNRRRDRKPLLPDARHPFHEERRRAPEGRGERIHDDPTVAAFLTDPGPLRGETVSWLERNGPELLARIEEMIMSFDRNLSQMPDEAQPNARTMFDLAVGCIFFMSLENIQPQDQREFIDTVKTVFAKRKIRVPQADRLARRVMKMHRKGWSSDYIAQVTGINPDVLRNILEGKVTK